MATADNIGYTTESELAFLAGLGRHGGFGLSRNQLLRLYRDAALRRSRWGRICRETVLKAVDHMISLEASWAISNRVRK